MRSYVFQSEIPDTPSKGLTTVKFKKTPVIHPIAISIVINSLDKLPTQYTPQGIAVTLYGRTSSLKNLQRTLQVSVDSFMHYTGYYNFNIPMEKYGMHFHMFLTFILLYVFIFRYYRKDGMFSNNGECLSTCFLVSRTGTCFCQGRT